jgi:hypothetical protein
VLTVRQINVHHGVAAGQTETLTAMCPPRFHVSDGGFSLQDGAVFASVPVDGGDADHAPDDGWRVRVKNAGTMASRLDVFAVCVK